MRDTAGHATRKYAIQLTFAAAAAAASRNMASNTDAPGTIYRWIEKKPLTEAVSWTSREKFWLMTAACNYGTNDWRSVAQVVRNSGEPYRPRDWYTSKNCERQFKIIVSNASKELKSLPLAEMLQQIAGTLQADYIRDASKSKDVLKTKYCNLFSILNRVKQGNLSRNEVVNLYSQARRNEIDGKQYMEQLMTRQNASLASENLSSGLPEEPIKWNTPSAPLLTSLLRSRNTIPANRTVTNITSLLQSPGGTSRTRSGKLLPLSSNVRTTQGTPTLSKLLEAPANPYIPSPSQSAEKNKQSEIDVTEKLVGNTPRKENSQSTSLNRVQVDNITTPGSFNQLNKSDLSASKRQTPKSPISAIKNGSNVNSNIVNLLSDSENEDDDNSSTQNIQPKNVFGEKKDISTIHKIEPRATRSQTRAEGSFKQINDNKLSDGKKQQILRQQSGESQITENNLIDDELIDIDQIEIEPLPSVQDEITTQTPSKVTRLSMQRLRMNSSVENILTNKVNTKKISNKMLEEISANFVLNSTLKNVATDYKNVMVGQSRIDNSNISGRFISIDGSAVKDNILLPKDGQSFPNSGNTLTTLDAKLLKQKRIIELKGANIKCIDGRNDAKFLSFANQPIVVVNKLKKPYNIKLGSELKDKTDDIQVINNDAKKNIKLHNNSQNLVQLLDGNCSFDDDVIIIDDDVNINDDSALTKTKEICSKTQLKNLPLLSTGANDSSNLTANLKPTGLQLNENKPKNDKTSWKMFEKTQESSEMSLKKSSNQDISKTGNVKDTNSQFIKELDFDFDQSISQASLSELYNGVEEIVEMHSFDNEELNSLIECGSLDSSEIVEHRNPVSLDRCESSVSESGSTIGAFDTFAQITGVSQMPSTSKDMKSISRESRTAKQRGKNLEGGEGFVQSDEIDDDHSSTVSVTGIPILQGVISDVMSRIDSDRNAALKAINQQNVLTDEIVEISSDEEEEERNSDNIKQHSSNVNERIKNQECTKEFKKLKADKIKIIEEPKFIKLNYECETDNIKVRQINNSSIVIKNDKSDIINVKSRTLNMIRKSVDNKLMEIVSIESKKEIDSKIVEDKLIKTDKTKEINIKKKDQVKLRQDEVLKTTKDAEEKLTKKVEVRKEKDEEQSVKNIQKKEVEIKESKTEIINESEPPKNEIKNTKGTETIKLKEIELIKRVKEAEMKNTKETEIQKAKEGEVRKPKETELQREREAQVQKEKEAVIQREKEAMIQKEIEIQRAKEEEIKNAKEEEIKQAKEDEIKKAKEEQIKRAKEEELKKAKYEEVQRAKEEEAKIKNEEINKAKEEEIKRTKEAEIKKAKEEELRKAEEEAELNKNKEAELRKAKEIEQKKIIEAEKKKNEEKIASTKEVELEKIKNKEVVEEEIKKAKEVESLNENKLLALEEQSKKSKKIEHSEIKKTNIKESESETIKLKEQDLKRISENEEKIVKETETKIITRKRGLKIEEKIKESNIVLRNINKSCTPIKSSGQLSTNVENSSISNHDCRKSKQVDDEIKVNQNKLINSEVVVVLDDCKTNQNEIGSKLRTRSSTSLKQVKLLETKSTSPHKSGNEEHEVGLFPNVVGTKTKTLSSHHEIPTTSSNIQNNTELCGIESTKLLYDNMNSKQLVVVLSPDDVLNHGDDIGSDHINISSDKPENNVINNEHILQKTIDDIENMEKPTPKKRGRKRRIDVQNEQLQLPNSDKSTLQNGSTIAINQSSTSDVEPPAKRTRRNTETRESKKETVEKKHEDEKNSRLRIVRILFDSLCVNLKYYISRMEAQLKDVSLEHSIVTKKMPFRLEDIKRKVYAGEILKVSHLQVEFMTMAFNVLFSTKSNTSLYDDVTNFQTSLIDCCQVLMNTIDDKYNDDDEDEEEEDDDDNDDDDDIYQDEISKKRKSIVDNSIDNNDDSDDTGDEQTTTNNIVNTYISSGESSDDSDSSPAKMRKIKYSFSDNTSTYDEDSDDNDSNVT